MFSPKTILDGRDERRYSPCRDRRTVAILLTSFCWPACEKGAAILTRKWVLSRVRDLRHSIDRFHQSASALVNLVADWRRGRTRRHKLLTALLRHRIRRSSCAGHFSGRDRSETDRIARSSANNLRDRFYEGLAKHWPETRNEPPHVPERSVPTTVADLMRSNVRRALRNNFEEFIRDSHESARRSFGVGRSQGASPRFVLATK